MRTPALAVAIFLLQVAPAAAAPPVPSYSVTPNPPVAGEVASFLDTSTDSGPRPIVKVEWDFQNDGTWDVTQDPVTDPPTAVSHTYPSAGSWSLRMRVTDGNQEVGESVSLIQVAAPNAAPIAQFAFAPSDPAVGEQISFESFSSDSDGSVASQVWDLDNDGDFDDGTGTTATIASLPQGSNTVSLRVTDDDGAVATVARSVTVGAAPGNAAPVAQFTFTPPITPTTPTPAPAPPPAKPSLMSPFPIVRIAGTVLPRGARVRTLEVRTSVGSRITVRCVGRSCPFARATSVADERLVRFRGMRGFLRAGVALSISVRKTGQIGKYTRFVIRAGRVPKRIDRCLMPGRSSPSECPES